MPWTSLSLQTVTPVFNGTGDEAAGIRVPSLRGAMRYWFRALAAPYVGDDLRLLKGMEAEVFGSTERQSRVILRISDPPKTVSLNEAAFLKGDEKNPRRQQLIYLLGQGLYNRKEKVQKRDYVEALTDFDVNLRFTRGTSEETQSLVLASLWLLCAYGGIGARVRRGFGGLRITGAQNLPDHWQPDDLISPGTDHYEALDRLTAHHRPLTDHPKWLEALEAAPPDLASRTAEWKSGRPSYPALGPHTVTALRPAPGSWTTLLTVAGKEWRHFRASVPAKDPNGFPTTPEYHDVVLGESKDFPLGALGLPVGFYARHKNKPDTKEVVNAHPQAAAKRSAAPLRSGSESSARPTTAATLHLRLSGLVPALRYESTHEERRADAPGLRRAHGRPCEPVGGHDPHGRHLRTRRPTTRRPLTCRPLSPSSSTPSAPGSRTPVSSTASPAHSSRTTAPTTQHRSSSSPSSNPPRPLTHSPAHARLLVRRQPGTRPGPLIQGRPSRQHPLPDHPGRTAPGILHRPRHLAPATRATLIFHSPTYFTRSGESDLTPGPVLILNSYRRSWNTGVGPGSPLHMDGTDLAGLQATVRVADLSLTTATRDSGYGRRRTGFIGSLTLYLARGASTQNQHLFSTLMRFAPYAGTGAGTTHGFGATTSKIAGRRTATTN
ncbi:type III-B CRISPR module RAMP protein Cmr1 [Streptomyces sp. INA 01156]